MTPATVPVPERLKKLDELSLDSGGHGSFEEGVCATEAVAWLAGEEHTDHPKCLSPILGAFLRSWNDGTDAEGRQELKPYLARAIGTAGDGKDELRGWLAADWLVRVHTPAWLEVAGITDAAKALRELAPLRDPKSLDAARPSLEEARQKAAAAWDAAWDAARDAAWDAAWDAARDAAWAAAWDAARDAARDAAAAAARAAAWDAAAAAARAAAWAAARDAAWDAARDAADSLPDSASYTKKYRAARAAADKALKEAGVTEKFDGVTVELKASALQLLEQLIDPADRARRGTNPPPATRPQRDYLRALVGRAGMETPIVSWRHQASDAIERLERYLREPTLWSEAA